ncbi:hypothetical protein D3C85_382290 [compost metagenome]
MQLSNVSGRYGAPMGRTESRDTTDTANAPRRFYLERVRLNNGGYDAGGAYWGIGCPLYRAYSDTSADGKTNLTPVETFHRARTRDDAKTEVRKAYPAAHFFR